MTLPASQQHNRLVVPQARTIKLITKGRITGLPHVVELRFVIANNTFLVLAGARPTDWLRNCLTSGQAVVRLHDLMYEVSARVATQDERVAARAAFVAKYGLGTFRNWYGDRSECLWLAPSSPPLVRSPGSALGQTRQDYEEWKKQNRDYYRAIAEAFDSAAPEYDFSISRNFLNTWVRRRSVRELLRLARPDDVVIEIGCGTGVEALQIAAHVSQVVATDISKAMLEILERKATAWKAAERIVPVQLKASEIGEVARYLPHGTSRLAYSFDGALNCEPNMRDFVVGLAGVMRDGGYFVCSVLNTLCATEGLAYAAALQFDKMASRKKQPMVLSAGGRPAPCLAYPPSKFEQSFRPYFRLKKRVGLPAFLPPPYLNEHYLRFRPVGAIFERLEPLLSSWPPFNRWGDQTLFIFEKT
jgi:SAM-dependent methyltransferase